MSPHGTNGRYIGGCRCDSCRAAGTQAKRDQIEKRRRHGPLRVPSNEARDHIMFLRKHGHGNRGIARMAGVNKSTITDILYQHRPVIRLDTAEAILSTRPGIVTKESRIPIGPVKRLVRQMQVSGIPLAQQARMLGMRSPALSFMYGAETVYEPTHRKVLTLYRLLARQGRVPASVLEEVGA